MRVLCVSGRTKNPKAMTIKFIISYGWADMFYTVER